MKWIDVFLKKISEKDLYFKPPKNITGIMSEFWNVPTPSKKGFQTIDIWSNFAKWFGLSTF